MTNLHGIRAMLFAPKTPSYVLLRKRTYALLPRCAQAWISTLNDRGRQIGKGGRSKGSTDTQGNGNNGQMQAHYAPVFELRQFASTADDPQLSTAKQPA
ncbi:hypothetical protein RvY_11658 [Ramazzottius varieornatus]|uniref:Uncharacterized protein n=1 Tax=Ramazzottius varieornatus TaxID=947166 RepID=A0A1D1VGX3_RAMVA|nr:hypothetical protein RvY_11658 [Ramazzottius varieornatus]